MKNLFYALKFIVVTVLLVSTSTLSVAQQPGNALSVNGSSQYVLVPDNDALDLTNNFTVEAWIMPNSFNFLGGIVSKWNVLNGQGFSLRLGTTSPYTSIDFCGVTTANGLLTAGKWYHVAGVVNAGQVTIYIDGVSKQTGSPGYSLTSNSGALSIGRDYTVSPRYLNGNIDEVRIWNDVRTQAEIQANMFTELTPASESNLVAYYKCNESTGSSTLTDSKSSLTGNVSGSPTFTYSYAWLGGNYSVNPSGTGHFTTFAAAVTTLNTSHLSSSVIFNLKDDATFAETATQTITATGTATKTITVQRSNDGTNKPKLQFTGTSNTDDCIQLNNCDYITIDGLEIQPNGTTSNNFVERGIYLNGTNGTDGCQHNTIKNCDIKFGGGGTTNTSANEGILADNNASSAAGASSYNTFLNNNIDKATRGYMFYGTAGNPDISNTIITAESGTAAITDIGYGNNASRTFGIGFEQQTGFEIANQAISFRNAAITAASNRVEGICSTAGLNVNTVSIHHNTITGLTVNKSDASMEVKLIHLNENSSANIYNNTIQAVDNQNTTSSGVWGIFVGQGASSIYNNTITGLKNNSSATNNGRVVGIESSGTTNRVYNNKIYDLNYVNSALISWNFANVIGIMAVASTTDTIYNNMIYQLYAPAVNGRAVSGIELTSNTVNASVLFNTIYIDGTSTNSGNQSACLYMANTGTLDLRNNIFINNSVMTTGTRAVAIYKSSSGVPNLTTASNNNIYYTGTPGSKNLIFYNGTEYQTLASYQALWSSSPKREQTSVTEANTPFMSTSGSYDLHINPSGTTLASRAGSPVNSVIATDIDGTKRSNVSPDLGADEFNQTAIVWTGAIDIDWNKAGNWNPAQVPTATEIAIVSSVGITNFPVVNELPATPAVCKDLTIQTGAKVTIAAGKALSVNGILTNQAGIAGLVVQSTSGASDGTGSLINSTAGVQGTVERYVTGDLWHLISPAATAGETVASFVDNNLVARNATNYALAPWNEGTGKWDYYKVAGPNTGQFGTPAKGFQVMRTTGAGTGNGTNGGSGKLTLKGTLAAADLNISVTKSGFGWNLIGNPYPCALDVEKFLTANASVIDPSYLRIYVSKIYDVTAYGYDANTAGLKLASGEGFFIRTKAGGGSISFTTAMKSNVSDAFKAASIDNPVIRLTAEDGNAKLGTTIEYTGDATKGLDPGKDAGLFNGTASSFSLFTRLIEDNGVDFTIQTLPDNNYDTMVVPVGLVADKGATVTFKAIANNLPAGYKVVLEDKETASFTRLDEANSSYTVSLNAASNGTGRFFLHTDEIVSAIDESLLNEFKVVPIPEQHLVRILGNFDLPAKAMVYDMNGKLVATSVLTSQIENDIQLYNSGTGVYLLKVETGKGLETVKFVWKRK